MPEPLTVGDLWDLAATCPDDGHEVLANTYEWRHSAQSARGGSFVAAGIALATGVVLPFITGSIERTTSSSWLGGVGIGLAVGLVGLGMSAFAPLRQIRDEYVSASQDFGILRRFFT
jgi:hypothetical protein